MSHEEPIITEAEGETPPQPPQAEEPPRPEEDVADAAEAPDPDGAAAEAVAEEEPVDVAALQERAAKADEYLALAQRSQADFENFRKRMTAQVGQAEVRGVGKLAKELFGALDNLERALAAADAGGVEPEFVKGMRLVQGELHGALQRSGIEGFSPKGEVFDPNQHEAMVQQPVEGAESGTVVEVYQQGYRLADTILRPARVVVAA